MFDAISNYFNKPVKPVAPVMTNNISGMYTPPVATSTKPITPVAPDDIFTKASKATQKKYGIVVPPHFLRAIHQQESSGIVDKTNYNLAMGFTPTAITALGKDYLQPTSLGNVVQNSANYLATRARGTLDTGDKFDLSTPENFSKWYVQRYVGLLPGKTRTINGEKVSYEKLVNLFEKRLKEQ